MAIIYKNGIAYGNQRVLDATLTQQGEDADAKAVGDALALKAGTGVIADDFSTSQSYAIGDYTYYNGSLYRFTAAHSAGAWVGTDAQAVQLAEDVVDLKNTLSHKADVIYDTASGDIASFPDGADGLPVKDLTVGIEPVQDTSGGDPSPTHICPISGWTGCNVTRTGKNLCDKSKFVQGTFTNEGVPASSTTRLRSDFVAIAPNTQHVITSNLVVHEIYYYDKNKNFVRKDFDTQPLISPNRASYVRFSVRKSDSTTVTTSDLTEAMVAFGTDTSYESFVETTIPISWQSEAGTVYGGTLELPSCVLTVTDANIASYNGETLPGEWISDRDVYAAGTTPTTGAQVVYKLAKPQTYQLDSVTVLTLLGQNNIWSDCGPSTVEYQADTKLYIQKINTPTDDDMIADANIASGQYFIVNNNLYLSTAAILAGDPIKPGTNCTPTNLAAALNALNS